MIGAKKGGKIRFAVFMGAKKAFFGYNSVFDFFLCAVIERDKKDLTKDKNGL